MSAFSLWALSSSSFSSMQQIVDLILNICTSLCGWFMTWVLSGQNESHTVNNTQSSDWQSLSFWWIMSFLSYLFYSMKPFFWPLLCVPLGIKHQSIQTPSANMTEPFSAHLRSDLRSASHTLPCQAELAHTHRLSLAQTRSCQPLFLQEAADN